jgi:hypothetical protein
MVYIKAILKYFSHLAVNIAYLTLGTRLGLFHSHLARFRMNSESNSVRVSVSPWEKVVSRRLRKSYSPLKRT